MAVLVDALFSLGTIPLFAASIVILSGLNTYLNYRRALRSIENHPGVSSVFSIQGFISNALPPIPGIAIGHNWGQRMHHSIFAKSGWDIISAVSICPRVSVGWLVADPLVIKEITMNRSRFPKDTESYDLLAFYGRNILITEGEEWKKHRKIAAPAFSERNNKLVWDETIRVMLEVFENWGPDNREIVVGHGNDITLPITLLIICAAGFGRHVPWKEDGEIPPGHKLSFKRAIHTVSTHVLVRLLTPRWVYRFSKTLAGIGLAFDELETYMQEMTDARKSVTVEERYDLLSALLEASEEDKEGLKLTDREIIGNIFIFLIAGHETTAHTLCYAMGLLALDQDEQERLYQNITSVLPKGGIPSYDKMNTLTHSLAVFYETLRLYPPVSTIPKVSTENTTIPAVRPDGSKGTIPVPKGTKIHISVPALHFNPRYWPEPDTFKPSRFLGDWPKEAFFPFSGGARACIGRKFAETEGVAIITMLVSRYKIELKDPEQYAGLNNAERRAKLLESKQGLTITPLSVPLIFKKR